jgi:hypothetical protein
MKFPIKVNRISTKKLAILSGAFCAAMLALSHNASALTIGDTHELGQVRPPVPEGDADITQYVNFMIGLALGGSGHVIIGPHDALVTRSLNDFGPLPSPATLALRGTDTTIDLGATAGVYDYLFAHYGGPGGGTAEVWFVGDLSGIITIPATGFGGYGLSGWALFTAPGGAVPDGGATVILLGAGVCVLGIARRYIMS